LNVGLARFWRFVLLVMVVALNWIMVFMLN